MIVYTYLGHGFKKLFYEFSQNYFLNADDTKSILKKKKKINHKESKSQTSVND